MSTTTTTLHAPTPDPRRFAGWLEIAMAVAFGCPIPLSIYVSRTGNHIGLTVTSAEDVAVWAAHLGLTERPPHIYHAGLDQYQRTVCAERDSNGVWLTVSHNTTVTDTDAQATP